MVFSAYRRRKWSPSAAFWCLLTALLLAGCGSAPPGENANLGLDLEELEVARIPRLFVDAQTLTAEIRSAQLFLSEDYELRFLPVVMGAAGEVEVVTSIHSSGDEVEIARQKPIEPARRFANSELPARLLETSGIDLSSYRDRSFNIKWSLAGTPSAGATVYLANPRLVRKADELERPDILLICSDAHRFDHAFGEPGRQLMPELNRWAQDATLYTYAHTTASWTMPSIASSLTGLFSRLHGTGRLNSEVPRDEFEPAQVPAGQFPFQSGRFVRLLSAYPDAFITLPEALTEAGYRTGLVASNPLYFLSGLGYDGAEIVVDTGVVPGNEVNQAAFRVLDAAPSEEPLFLLVHYMDVHHWQPWYFNQNHPDLNVGQAPREVRESYRQAARDADRFISSLLKRWDEKRGRENGLVAFYSDHGEHLHDPGVGHGATMRDALLHIPLALRYPGNGEGQSVDETVSLADLVPTVLEVAGVAFEGELLSGRSLWKQDFSQEESRPVFADFQLYGEAQSAVRLAREKLILNLERNEMIFVGGDADETKGHFGTFRSDRAAVLLAEFVRYLTEVESEATFSSDQSIDQEEALEALRSLGYVN